MAYEPTNNELFLKDVARHQAMGKCYQDAYCAAKTQEPGRTHYENWMKDIDAKTPGQKKQRLDLPNPDFMPPGPASIVRALKKEQTHD